MDGAWILVVLLVVGFLMYRYRGHLGGRLNNAEQAGADQLVHFLRACDAQLDRSTALAVRGVALSTYSGPFRERIEAGLREAADTE